jgi:four helix bundle protein
MFDFEKLEVYKKAKTFNLSIQKFLIAGACDNAIRNQLRRAALSIALNIAEGSGRRTGPDKRNFFVIARGSVFESIAILDILKDEGVLSVDIYTDFYNLGEELSKMLYSMIQTYQ